jgi:hypothetical protein
MTHTHNETTPMTTSQQQTSGRPGRREDEFWRNPLLHLGVCLAAGAVVSLVLFAIHAIHW